MTVKFESLNTTGNVHQFSTILTFVVDDRDALYVGWIVEKDGTNYIVESIENVSTAEEEEEGWIFWKHTCEKQ
jgi:hypothetical protein